MNELDSQRHALEALIAECKASLTTTAAEEGAKLDAEVGALLKNLRTWRETGTQAAVENEPVLAQTPRQVAPIRTILVIGVHRLGPEIIATAERIARRAALPAKVVIAGPKTLIEGDHPRVKSARELEAVSREWDGITVVALASSAIGAHQKMLNSLLSGIEQARVWHVIDLIDGVEAVNLQLEELALRAPADRVAVLNAWDAPEKDWASLIGTPIAMIDAAPASGELWRLIRERSISAD